MTTLIHMFVSLLIVAGVKPVCDRSYAETLRLCGRECQIQYGLQALRPTLRPAAAASLATDLLRAADATNVDPWDLLGVAANESDLRTDSVGPDGYDCGITQVRTLYSRYDCETLKARPDIAFRETAEALAKYVQRCEGRTDFDRCVLNTYNSGTRYATEGVHGRYWLRVRCFAERARRGIAGTGCRSI